MIHKTVCDDTKPCPSGVKLDCQGGLGIGGSLWAVRAQNRQPQPQASPVPPSWAPSLPPVSPAPLKLWPLAPELSHLPDPLGGSAVSSVEDPVTPVQCRVDSSGSARLPGAWSHPFLYPELPTRFPFLSEVPLLLSIHGALSRRQMWK